MGSTKERPAYITCKESSVVWGLGVLFMSLLCTPIELRKLDNFFLFYNIKNKTNKQINSCISQFIIQHNFNSILIQDNYYASDLLNNMLELDPKKELVYENLKTIKITL